MLIKNFLKSISLRYICKNLIKNSDEIYSIEFILIKTTTSFM